jgi:hypothetical protein
LGWEKLRKCFTTVYGNNKGREKKEYMWQKEKLWQKGKNKGIEKRKEWERGERMKTDKNGKNKSRNKEIYDKKN